MRKIEYVVSNERLITPSGLSLVGCQVGSNQKSKPDADREMLSAADQERRYSFDHDRTAVKGEIRF